MNRSKTTESIKGMEEHQVTYVQSKGPGRGKERGQTTNEREESAVHDH